MIDDKNSSNDFNALLLLLDFVPIYEGRSVVCLQMSDTGAAMKDINQAIRIRKSAELFVNRGVIFQVDFHINKSFVLRINKIAL